MGRGVVVTTHCGSEPSRSANCSLSQARSGRRHLHSSSHQAASNWGPRRLSGSSAANICAIVPLGQTSWLRETSNLRALGGGWIDSRPDRPSIITLRTWPMVSPTSAMRRARCRL